LSSSRFSMLRMPPVIFARLRPTKLFTSPVFPPILVVVLAVSYLQHERSQNIPR
jgi:hypothetical protein